MLKRGFEGGPEGWGAQNFAFFFSFSRRKFHSVFSWIVVVFEAAGPSNVHVWSSRVV